jgi:D-alanyl-D-alanine carboxypeptidase
MAALLRLQTPVAFAFVPHSAQKMLDIATALQLIGLSNSWETSIQNRMERLESTRRGKHDVAG